MRCVVLDDYQNVAAYAADWSAADVELVSLTEHVDDEATLAGGSPGPRSSSRCASGRGSRRRCSTASPTFDSWSRRAWAMPPSISRPPPPTA